VIGLLYVDSRRPGAAFADLDLEILAALAEQAAIVLASIQLDRRIRRLAEASGREVLAALQRRIDTLPARP
jgi:GAF domain-containing protein